MSPTASDGRCGMLVMLPCASCRYSSLCWLPTVVALSRLFCLAWLDQAGFVVGVAACPAATARRMDHPGDVADLVVFVAPRCSGHRLAVVGMGQSPRAAHRSDLRAWAAAAGRRRSARCARGRSRFGQAVDRVVDIIGARLDPPVVEEDDVCMSASSSMWVILPAGS